MHVLIWSIWGCESRPQPGSPVVFVETEESGNTLSEEVVQEKGNSEEEESLEDDKSDDDLFSDRSFEVSSEQMIKNDASAVLSTSKEEGTVQSNNNGIVTTDTVGQEEPVNDPRDDADTKSDSDPLSSNNMPFVLVDLLETVPPRAVLMLPSGEEIVVKAGMLIPEFNMIVLAVGTKSATLVRVSGAGDTSDMEPLRLTPLY